MEKQSGGVSMKINIALKISLESDWIDRTVEPGTTIEQLLQEYQAGLPYQVLAAKVKNRVRALTEKIEVPCRITFLDIREPSANQIYQRGVSFLYLKAVHDILGNVRVLIENSLNKGLYTDIKTKDRLPDETIQLIEARMAEIVSQDIPFVRSVLQKEEAFQILSMGDHEEKMRMLARASQVDTVPIYSCDGFLNFFYGTMVPSAGYIKHFELRRYRNGILLRFPSSLVPDQVPPFEDEHLLYQAFGEAKKWGNLMGISYVGELNQKIESGDYKEIMQVSEALHEKKIAQIADHILKEGKRIILICGPSSSGKTSFAKRLCIQLMVNGQKPLYLGTDDYFVERDQTPRLPNGDYNFEDIDALDVELFNKNMNDLLVGKAVDLPYFDFKSGGKVFGERITRARSGQPIVIEGIHGLNEKLTSEIPEETKYKIYISPLTQLNIDNHNRIPTTDARMLRRIVRDHNFRGNTAQSTIAQWPKVRAGEDKNIFPFNSEADVLFNSSHIYELAVLKKYAEPLLESITPEEESYCEAVRMLKFLRFFKTINDDSYIANNSILREFIGGSILV
ncbi:MAG: nucleoside kinase [Eubacteriales bacterium]|nr:nucleoside kinase [Eubacteriales bacterium]MDD3349709.1 nucleoside kinase [Eubacteriales bacterium]